MDLLHAPANPAVGTGTMPYLRNGSDSCIYGPIFGQYYVCLVRGAARDTEEGSSHRWFLVPEFRQAFLESPSPADELSTVDLLAMRVVFRDRLLEPLLR